MYVQISEMEDLNVRPLISNVRLIYLDLVLVDAYYSGLHAVQDTHPQGLVL